MLGSDGDDIYLVEAMAKKRTTIRDAGSGKLIVSGPQRSSGGKESYTISADKKGHGGSRTVSTSSSTAASLDVITKKHSKALKRLADK